MSNLISCESLLVDRMSSTWMRITMNFLPWDLVSVCFWGWHCSRGRMSGCHPRLLQGWHAGEGAHGEKVEGLGNHLKIEEKRGRMSWKPRHTREVTMLAFILLIWILHTYNYKPLPCTNAMRFHNRLQSC